MHQLYRIIWEFPVEGAILLKAAIAVLYGGLLIQAPNDILIVQLVEPRTVGIVLAIAGGLKLAGLMTQQRALTLCAIGASILSWTLVLVTVMLTFGPSRVPLLAALFLTFTVSSIWTFLRIYLDPYRIQASRIRARLF